MTNKLNRLKSIKPLESKTSMLFSLDVANNTILSGSFFS